MLQCIDPPHLFNHEEYKIKNHDQETFRKGCHTHGNSIPTYVTAGKYKSPSYITNYKFQTHILIPASHLTCNIWCQTCYCVKKWKQRTYTYNCSFMYVCIYPIRTKDISNFPHNPTCMFLLTFTCTLYMTHITHFCHLFLYY